MDAGFAEDAGESYSVAALSTYIQEELTELAASWPADGNLEPAEAIREALGGERPSFSFVAERAVIAGEYLDRYIRNLANPFGAGSVDLLEPEIVASSYSQLRNRHFREAAFNSIVAVFELLRGRTGLTGDGADLAARALSLTNPRLVVGNLDTQTGQDEQKGFIQLLQGAYQAIRNPKAHSLAPDLDERGCWQQLILASFLVRRLREASLV
jgi:uncharacterized protein (TIGR02391 family)